MARLPGSIVPTAGCYGGYSAEVKNYSSRRRLHGFQEREDLPERIVVQDGLPDRHALVELALRDRLVEDAWRLVTVTQCESAEVTRALALIGVRPVAVRTVLIEQAPTFVDHIGAT